jgi:type IV fimbrial biogenesis protein FimT
MLRRAMKAKQTGFTLIELMFTIVVLAVLLGVGVPNFRDFIRNSRLSTAANDLLADVNLARSESVKRRVPVSLCKSTDGATCETSNTTAFKRWIVFVDDANSLAASANDGNGAVDSGEVVLKDTAISAAISTAAGDGRRIVYLPSGFPNAGTSDRVTRLLLCDSRGSAISTGGISAARGVSISATGRAAVSRDKAKIDALTTSGGFGGCP